MTTSTEREGERQMENSFDPHHPHEPAIPPALDSEGRCLVCVLMVQVDEAERKVRAIDAAIASGDLIPRDRLEPSIDVAHIERQRRWSLETFGPGSRLGEVVDHIRKELQEIEAPTNLSEWVDVVILALDGACRAGWNSRQIIDAIKSKQEKNESRIWPDWRTMSEDVAIER